MNYFVVMLYLFRILFSTNLIITDATRHTMRHTDIWQTKS